eukprot:scaffold68096_cov24-Tisochrysis_lutea.AAC.1
MSALVPAPVPLRSSSHPSPPLVLHLALRHGFFCVDPPQRLEGVHREEDGARGGVDLIFAVPHPQVVQQRTLRQVGELHHVRSPLQR